MNNKLTLGNLRIANVARLSLFKNSRGEQAHSMPDGSDWSRAEWFEALVGEIGEYANMSKKFRRGDIDSDEFMVAAKKELADCQVYLDLLAFNLGIDLAQATVDKFNEVSLRVNCPIRLLDGGAQVFFNP